MHARMIQYNENTNKSNTCKEINLSTVSEPSEMKPNLVDRTCELLK